MITNIMRAALFLYFIIVLGAQAGTIPDSVRYKASNKTWSDWVINDVVYNDSFIQQFITSEALGFLSYFMVTGGASIVPGLIMNKSLYLAPRQLFVSLLLTTPMYLYQKVNSVNDILRMDNIYLYGAAAARAYYVQIYILESIKWHGGFETITHTIDDDDKKISKTANITLTIPPASTSTLHWAVKTLWTTIKKQAGCDTTSTVDDIEKLSTKIAYWDINKSDADNYGVEGWLTWFQSIFTKQNVGREKLFLESLAKLTSLLGHNQTIRIFMSQYFSGKMELKFAVIEKDNDNGIIYSTPLINIPLDVSDNARSLSDQIAYKDSNYDNLHSPFSHINVIAESLQESGFPSISGDMLSKCNHVTSSHTVDIKREPIMVFSASTEDIYATRENIWFFVNRYNTENRTSFEITTSFGYDVFNIKDEDYTNTQESIITELTRKNEILTIIKDKALKDLEKHNLK
ncbi:MAG: hypothetical protein QS721_12115 [Candidatus Endonucleobacter sp. (ex Gigantidas childressi)]|nr:hypothetical protein [Candidatus Endonucleobacter sp. (ex Gigantidas childressi)]